MARTTSISQAFSARSLAGSGNGTCANATSAPSVARQVRKSLESGQQARVLPIQFVACMTIPE